MTFKRKSGMNVGALDQHLDTEILSGNCELCQSENPWRFCPAVRELGVVFLTEKDQKEREAAEKNLITILQIDAYFPKMKFTALYFLKNNSVVVSDAHQQIIADFEKDPRRAMIVEEAMKRLPGC